MDFWDDDDIAPGLLPHDDDDEGIEEHYLDAVFSQSQGAPNNLPGAGPPLPSPDEIHTTFIPTHKWPPKAARAEFTRECSDLWRKLAQQPENTQLWKKLLMHCAQFKRGPKIFRKGTKRGPDFEQNGDLKGTKRGPKREPET